MANKLIAHRPFAAFDIDGTLIRWQLFHAVTDKLARSGYLDDADYDAIRQARKSWKMRSQPDSFSSYEVAMIEGFEKIIARITVKQFETAADAVLQEYQDQIYTYSKELIAELRAQNYILFAISGSQNELVSRIAKYYGFDDFIGTEYVKKAGKFTGEKIFHAHDKKAALKSLIKKHNAEIQNSVVIGDSTGDIAMLELADRPIAFNPDMRLYGKARQSGWQITLKRKNVVYTLLPGNGGYLLD